MQDLTLGISIQGLTLTPARVPLTERQRAISALVRTHARICVRQHASGFAQPFADAPLKTGEAIVAWFRFATGSFVTRPVAYGRFFYPVFYSQNRRRM